MNLHDIAFGITTCPRTEATFEQSVSSFRAVFGFEPRVFNDAELAGVVNNWTAAATHLTQSGKPYLCIVQDDFTYTVHATDAIKAIDYKDRDGYYNLFMAAQPGLIDDLKDGWNAVGSGKDVWGAMWVLRCDMVSDMLGCGKFKELTDGKRTGLDHAVDKWCQVMGLNRHVHSPSLAIHIGRTSTMGHDFVNTHGW